MALNSFQCNQLTPLPFEGLNLWLFVTATKGRVLTSCTWV